MTQIRKKIVVLFNDPLLVSELDDLANNIDIEVVTETAGFGGQSYLAYDEHGLHLCFPEKKKTVTVRVDFTEGAAAHRRKFGGGKGQAIAKAIGLNKGVKPSVLDATAGQGRDAFVLATLGCHVTMVERSPIAYALLHDGLKRARDFALLNDPDLKDILQRMSLFHGDSLLANEDVIHSKYDVVYLDPMFPERKKTASVKKEMKVFHEVIGADEDSDNLLEMALEKAKYRVVVKRPRIAPFLADEKPTYQLEGKTSRYDIYALKAMTES